MGTDTTRPRFPVKELITAGPNAAAVLVRHTVQTAGLDIQERVRAQRAAGDFNVETYVDQLIKSQLMLARAEGAGAGAVTTAAEFSSLVTGPAAVAVVATTMLTDMAALAVIQVRLSLMIAAAYGHGMEDVDGRVREILALHSLEMQAAKVAGPMAAASAQRVGKRLLMRHLRGPLLQSAVSSCGCISSSQ